MSLSMKKGVVLILFIIFVGCESPPVRRQELISQHSEWSPDLVTLIQNGYLAKGMDTEQVRAAWGAPCMSCTGTTKGDWGEAWEYATQIVFFDQSKRVVRWEKK